MRRCAGIGFLVAWGLLARSEDNVVRNPGFEQTDAAGATSEWPEKRPAYRFEGGSGRNGSRGLAYDNGDPKQYSFPTQRVDVQPGCCYRFEVWVRAEDLKGDESGATVCMEWSGPDGRWLGGAYAEGVRGTSGGWKRVVGTTRAIPTNAVRVTVAPYVRRGMTGRAWFDDLNVARYYPPLVSSVCSSPYRSTAAGGSVAFYAGLSLAEAGVDLKEVTGDFVVLDADGNAFRRVRPDVLERDFARWETDTTGWPVGDYLVRFELSTRDGKSRGSGETRFRRVVQLPQRRSWVDSRRRLIVDGRPFFPLGMYWSSVKEPELETYAKGPFNCLMPYGSPTPAQMDACAARGLRVIYSIKDIYSGTRWAPSGIKSESDEVAEIRRRVALHAGHPALIAWYINDEMPLDMVGRLTARQRLMEELDPNHPTWVVLYQYDQVRAYLPTFDVIGTDPYPVPEKPAGTALEWSRTTRDQSFGLRAMWQVPQVFDWGCYRKGAEADKARAPTLQEMRGMAWQCIAAGANGLVFYSFFDLSKKQAHDPFEKRWPEVCAMAEEIKRYIPVLLSDEPAPTPVCEGPASVEARTWRQGRSVYLLVVNGAAAPATATVSTGGTLRAVNVEFGEAPRPVQEGKLSFALAPLEPVLVRLDE